MYIVRCLNFGAVDFKREPGNICLHFEDGFGYVIWAHTLSHAVLVVIQRMFNADIRNDQFFSTYVSVNLEIFPTDWNMAV